MWRGRAGLLVALGLIGLAGCQAKSASTTEVSATRKVEPAAPPPNVNAAPVQDRNAFAEAMKNQAMQRSKGQ